MKSYLYDSSFNLQNRLKNGILKTVILWDLKI